MIYDLRDKVGRLSIQMAHLAERMVDVVSQLKSETEVLHTQSEDLRTKVEKLRLKDAVRSGGDSSRSSVWLVLVQVLTLIASATAILIVLFK